MLASVQPNRLAFGQHCADGCGACVLFGQVDAHTRNAAGACIVLVKLTACVDHHAVCIGQQRKVACASNGTTEAIQLILSGLQHGLVDLLQALNLSATHRLKRHLLRWRVPPCQTAFP